MKKLDPIQSAEKIGKDLNGELDADLEKAMGDGSEEEVISKQKVESDKKKGQETSPEEDIISKSGRKWDKEWAKKMGEADESGELKKGMSKEELDEAGDLELVDKFEKETKEGVSSEAERGKVEKKESSGEKLEALSEELKKAREEYIKKDYDMDKKANKFLKAFGLGRAGLGEYEKEIENYKNSYEEALKNYKDAVIDSEHVGDKEDVEIATRGFVIGENLNRESIRADLEAGEKGWSKTLIKGFSGVTEKYRKLSFKQKLLIGASVAGLGLASSAIGGAAAIGGGGIITTYKLLSWSVSSAGFSDVFEKIAQKGKGKKAEKEIENIKDSRFEGLELGMESSYEKLKEALDKNIEKIDGKIQKEKGWKVGRRYMGVVAGISMGVLSRYLGKEVAEYFQGETPEVARESGVNSEAIKEQVGQALHKSEYGTLGGSEVNSEAIKEQVKQALHDPKFDTLGETAAGVEAAEAINGIEIAKSGDSVWKLAENQLENRGYFKSLTGTPEEILAKKTYLIDAIKDKIAENPKDFGMVNANKLQIGQKIDFSEIFENKNDIGNIIDKAESLGKGDIESITQNLAGESPSHGVGVETAEVKTEMPGVETPVEMSAGVLQYETAETIKICANNNIEDWNNVKNVPAINFIDPETGEIRNEVVKNLKTAAEKVLPESAATPSNSDTVESWATKITNEAYKRGTLDELREQLVASRKL